jgi:uncharacterized protein DUF397
MDLTGAAWRESDSTGNGGARAEAATNLDWRKSSHSGQGNCVEVTTSRAWRKSSRSAAVDCVEVASEPGVVAVRDSKDPDGEPLVLTPGTWRAFLAGVRAGQYR